jgi:GNAT superfamily N-acetyltransferase
MAAPISSPAEIARFTQVNYHDRVALVALIDTTLVAIGCYERLLDTSTAEVAFVVADADPGRGLGTVLLGQLAVAARSCGLDRFVADTLASNRRMLEVFRDAGFPEHSDRDDGLIRVSLSLDPCEHYLEAHRRRQGLCRITPL